MAKSAGTIFMEAIAKHKATIGEYLVRRYFGKASLITTGSYLSRDWLSFTGNAATSFSVVGYIPRKGIVAEHVNYKMMPKPVHAKVEGGKTLTLEVDYSGRQNETRYGKAEIIKPMSSEAVDYVNSRRVNKLKTLSFIRIAHPIEYSDYLLTNEGKTHINSMHNDAIIIMK